MYFLLLLLTIHKHRCTMNVSKKADAAWKVVGFIPISLIGSIEIDTILKNKEKPEDI